MSRDVAHQWKPAWWWMLVASSLGVVLLISFLTLSASLGSAAPSASVSPTDTSSSLCQMTPSPSPVAVFIPGPTKTIRITKIVTLVKPGVTYTQIVTVTPTPTPVPSLTVTKESTRSPGVKIPTTLPSLMKKSKSSLSDWAWWVAGILALVLVVAVYLAFSGRRREYPAAHRAEDASPTPVAEDDYSISDYDPAGGDYDPALGGHAGESYWDYHDEERSGQDHTTTELPPVV